MDAGGLHSFVCKRAPGRITRHHALNDLIARSFASAGVLVTKEPSAYFEQTGKDLTAWHSPPWQSGKSLCWNVTVTCPLAASYIDGAAREAGSTAEMAASRKEEKYTEVEARHVFQPIAMETLGVFSSSARQFVCSLGHRISSSSGEARETCFLFQRISVLLQRFNAVLLHDRLPALDCADWVSYLGLFVSFSIFFSNPSGIYLPRV